MTEAELRPIVARNIAACRKQAGMTQAELAEKLNYSDKTISKWERAEGLPDLVVSQNIAELFGVPLDALLQNDTPQPADDARLIRQINARRRMILLMAVGLCWLTATVAYFAIRLIFPALPRVWLAYIYALPASCIVCTVFTCIWWAKPWRLLSISGIIWTLAVSIHLSFKMPNIYLIYVVAAVVQVLFFMFFYFLKIKQICKELMPYDKKRA